jgi:hypothetical protein
VVFARLSGSPSRKRSTRNNSRPTDYTDGSV